ncbi:Protein-serine/threonine phosphatase [Heracleum sosnowskyi]|uniref:protein-serine/threonine phosphatase n=1 Tax=Heracleum sosnowskyi TaxID=360622 RepID=A0AAD8MKY5_9APIA|nr:Protein-serine/threonine phosphatase [Heracleum sosnowskyi]
MEKIYPAIDVTLSLSSLVCDDSGIASNLDITQVQIQDPVSVLPTESFSGSERSFNSLKKTLSGVIESERKMSVAETVINGDSSWIPTDTMIQQNKDDIVDDGSGIKSKQLLALNANTGMSVPIAVKIEEIDDGQIVAKVFSLEKQSTEGKMSGSADDASSKVFTLKTSVISLQLPKEKITASDVVKMDYVPLWGSFSICGKRPEMEDTVTTVPQFLRIPTKMLLGDPVMTGMSQKFCPMTTIHFFGVYDGHGGSQVANYCRDRVHIALKEKLKVVEDNETEVKMTDTQQVQWEEIFTSCFQKIDDEVGGKVCHTELGESSDTSSGHIEPVAPETVGSTAVVALLCSSHIIVANCGDSRAVLYRGKEAKALSIDHKPNREDEYARIEASGGKVIQWNGHRVFGVLAMSRSIGDRYLKPWIIPQPEVTIVPRAREDECLVLASDGLWDVMTNDEACEVARRRILLWHKKNGPITNLDRGQGADPAANAAAEYLSLLALQKGSKDNISVIVVDLKAQRKFKNKS